MTSNFSFFHSVFYLFGELSTIFIKFEIVIWNSFSLEESKICRLGKGLEIDKFQHWQVKKISFPGTKSKRFYFTFSYCIKQPAICTPRPKESNVDFYILYLRNSIFEILLGGLSSERKTKVIGWSESDDFTKK